MNYLRKLLERFGYLPVSEIDRRAEELARKMADAEVYRRMEGIQQDAKEMAEKIRSEDDDSLEEFIDGRNPFFAAY